MRPIAHALLVVGLTPISSGVCSPLHDWTPVPADAKRTTPAHLAAYAGLPAGSVTRLQASAPAKSDSLPTLVLPSGESIAWQVIQQISHPGGHVSYVMAGEHGGYALFTSGDRASFGTLQTPHGSFRFESWDDQAWLVDLGHPDLRIEGADRGALNTPSENASIHGQSKWAAETANHGTAGDDADEPRFEGHASAKNHTAAIDVLFLYSNGFAARYPGSAAQTRIDHVRTIANLSLANSGVPLVVRQAGAVLNAYPDSEGSNETALVRMNDALAGRATVPAFSNLRTQRQDAGADLVVLLRPHDIETRGSCGIAMFPTGAPDVGVHVVSDSFSSWSLCDDDVFTHELGHNLGAEHQTGANSPQAGFGTAFVLLRRLHTVMGSFGTGSNDRHLGLHRFSNPATTCGGGPCGVAEVSDNARRIRDNTALVSGYLPPAAGTAPVEPPQAVDVDVDGDSAVESLDAFPFDPRYRFDSDRDGVADEIDAFAFDPAESADSDGDGIGNNVDSDDDNDGTPDLQDAFPTDPGETADSDDDLVGNNADRFPNNRSESRDTDNDGTGDNADPDADGDGAPDFVAATSLADHDLLVLSAGTDRVLRFDAASGLFGNVELYDPETPVGFGTQSSVAWHAPTKQIFALVSSDLRRYGRDNGRGRGTLVRPLASGSAGGFPGAFPTAMRVAPDGSVLLTEESTRSLLRYEAINGRAITLGEFGDSNVFFDSPRAGAVSAAGRYWVVTRDGFLSEFDLGSGSLLRRVQALQADVVATNNPTALAIASDGRQLLIADAFRHAVLRVDPDVAGNNTSLFIASRSGGLESPSAMAFGPDGRLYVSSAGNDKVLRFDGSTGAFIDTYIEAPARVPSGVLDEPRALAFAPKVGDRFPHDPQRRFLPISGGWYNPARSGHGFDLQRAGDQLSLIWYTYETDGTPTWYLGLGALQGARWETDLLKFRMLDGVASSSVVGSVALDFSSERSAQFSWTLPEGSGSEPVQPLYLGNSSESQFPTSAWYHPAESGWGLSVTHQGDLRYAMAFVYDAAGEPYWFIGAALDPADPHRFDMQWFVGDDRCPSCSGPADAEAFDGGTMRFVPTGLDSAGVRTQMASPAATWTRDELDFVRLTDPPTTVTGDPVID